MADAKVINKGGRFGIGVAVAALMLGVGLLAYQLQGRTSAGAPPATSAFYTDDGGKTFFKDDVNKLVPFDHKGKQAFRADVFQAADGKQFVGLIYRFTDGGKREMEMYISKKVKDPEGLARLSIEHRGMQVKPVNAPDKAWQLADDTAIEKLQAAMKSPSGAAAQLVQP